MGQQHDSNAEPDDTEGDAGGGKQLLLLIGGFFVFAGLASGVAAALMNPRAEGFVPSLISSISTFLLFRAVYKGHSWAQSLAVSLFAFGGFVIVLVAGIMSGILSRPWLLGVGALLTGVAWTVAATLAKNKSIQTFLRRQRKNNLVDI